VIAGHGCLPSNLKVLCLIDFNHELQVDVLPNSLKTLYLFSYNQKLKPNVLPKSLTTMSLWEFNQPLLKDSLPNSLVHLSLYSFTGSFESVGPLNNLSSIYIYTLNNSITTMISNILKLKIEFKVLANKEVSLLKTNLEHLTLVLKPPSFLDYLTLVFKSNRIGVGFLPHNLQCLKTNGIIESSDVIPNSCKSIITDYKLDPIMIPSL